MAGAAYAVLSGRESDPTGATARDDRTPAADGDDEAVDAVDAVDADEPDDDVLNLKLLIADDFDEDDFDEDDFDEAERDRTERDQAERDRTERDRAERDRATSGKQPGGTRPSRGAAAKSGKQVAQRASRSHPRQSAPATLRRRLRNSRIFPIALMLVVAGLVYGVYRAGAETPPNSGTNASATAAPTAQPLDEAKVAELMSKLQANPKDVETLRSLGDVYFQASDYKTAATWQQKILDINPNDINARLALGVALFNTGDTAGAEQHWLKVVELDPKQAEAHYDLGFLYLSKNPPDNAKAKAAWEEVIRIDPNSELAKTVSTHMDSLVDPSPSPSTTSSGGGK